VICGICVHGEKERCIQHFSRKGKPKGRLGLIMNRIRQRARFMRVEVHQDVSQKHERHRTWICDLDDTGVGGAHLRYS
jgi:hypothetical protein